MSQKSGGEAGPPPSTALAAGKLGFCLLSRLFSQADLSQMLKTGTKAYIMMLIQLSILFSVVD